MTKATAEAEAEAVVGGMMWWNVVVVSCLEPMMI